MIGAVGARYPSSYRKQGGSNKCTVRARRVRMGAVREYREGIVSVQDVDDEYTHHIGTG
jgi:hypothetical protein